jgi:hypothetical protein
MSLKIAPFSILIHIMSVWFVFMFKDSRWFFLHFFYFDLETDCAMLNIYDTRYASRGRIKHDKQSIDTKS